MRHARRTSLVGLIIPVLTTSARTSASTLLTFLSPGATLYTSVTTKASPIVSQETPDIPLPWLWKCHICHTTYRLSVTQRCLEDGHKFCFASPATASTGAQSGRKKRRSKVPESCTSSFDYTGWEAYNAWRNELHESSSSQSHSRRISTTNNATIHGDDDKENSNSTTEPAQSDCWHECSYPSECRHTRLAAKLHAAAPAASPTRTAANRGRARDRPALGEVEAAANAESMAADCEIELGQAEMGELHEWCAIAEQTCELVRHSGPESWRKSAASELVRILEDDEVISA